VPEGGDPLTSIGYLVAAAAITLGALLAYAVSLGQRLSHARARLRDLLDRGS
jgi:hypothetical protein